jgi:hypothetical protein
MGPETTRGLLYIKPPYTPMIYMALCIMLLMRAAFITWARERGLGPGNLNFFGPQMALAYRFNAISQGPKKVSISRARPSTTCPCNGCCPHQKQYARGHINHRCINSYYPPVRDYEFRDHIKSLSMDYCKVHTSAVFLLGPTPLRVSGAFDVYLCIVL